MNNFELKPDGFYFDGKKKKIMSGSMHYFRIFPEYWVDRLKKLKEMGLNCVETYTIWSLHEKKEGVFDFSGILDLKKYLQTIKDLGLYVVIRPGPYICSECDMGGLPWWLLSYDNIELRTSDDLFLEKTKKYLKKICEIIKPFLITNGGNVIMVQVENEYGAYGNDKNYLRFLCNFYRENGIDCPLVTSDWDLKDTLENGTIDDVYATVNYRWDSENAQKKLNEFHPQPYPNGTMELWNGSAVHFNEKCVKRDLCEIKKSVEGALKFTEFFNLYMFHGGSNFGFNNGAVYSGGKYIPQAQTYDVQAPLGEYGNKTEKYFLEQKTICDYMGFPIENKTENPVLSCYGEANFVGEMPLFRLDETSYYKTKSKNLLPMEKFGQAHGIICYEKEIEFSGGSYTFELPETIHDFLKIYIDNVFLGEFCQDGEKKFTATLTEGKHNLKFLCEEFGRVNFGKEILDYKGLIGEISYYKSDDVNKTVLIDYTVSCYPIENFKMTYGEAVVDFPCYSEYAIELNPCGDTFIKLEGFTRGAVFVNGFNLGRFWDVGPQKTLYMPKSLLVHGKNRIIVFDSQYKNAQKRVALIDEQIIEGYTK